MHQGLEGLAFSVNLVERHRLKGEGESDGRPLRSKSEILLKGLIRRAKRAGMQEQTRRRGERHGEAKRAVKSRVEETLGALHSKQTVLSR